MLAALPAAILFAGCGSGAPEQRRADPFEAIEREFDRGQPQERAAPRWEPVARLQGNGPFEREVDIAAGAVQWRVRWSCGKGEFRVSASPAGSGEGAEGRCPGHGSTGFIGHGRRLVAVEAASAWRATVEQEVETPLHEPPLAAMSHGEVLARGRFKPVERKGEGTATLYRLRSKRLALRMEDFRTTANVELFVWLSRARDPRTTRQALRTPHRQIRVLKSTLGDQNYLLPRGVRASTVRSVVIWCEPIRVAYAAAPLRPVSRGSATNSS
jgi:hypothetical protein